MIFQCISGLVWGKVGVNRLTPNEADFRRGRGWAVSTALIALAYYRERNPVMAEMARSTLIEVGCDFNPG
jgi:hypothetical protein